MRAADIRAFVGEAREPRLGAPRGDRASDPSGRSSSAASLPSSSRRSSEPARQPGPSSSATAVGSCLRMRRCSSTSSPATRRAEDETLVRQAGANDVEVVIVELWPQEDWTRPFVLSPFVVECRAGEGFPIREIADRIVEATEHAGALAARVPTIAEADAREPRQAGGDPLGSDRARRVAPRRVSSAARPRAGPYGLETACVSSGPAVSDELPVLAGGAATVLVSGFALRGLARAARTVLPAPLAHAASPPAAPGRSRRRYEALESRLPSA